MYEAILTQLGLSKKEAKIYEALLQSGESRPKELSKETNLKRATVYAVLDSLEGKKLVLRFKKNKKIHYKIEHPSQLAELIENEKEKISQIKKNLDSALPNLISLYNLASTKPGIKYFEGIKGVKEIYKDTLKEKTIIYAFLAANAPHPAILKWLEQFYVKKRVEKKIKALVIASQSPEARKYQKKDQDTLRETVLVPSKKFPFEMEIDIYARNKVAFISYKEDELFGFIVQSPAVYKTIKSIFNLIWATSKENHS